jgi:hypothetical protein
MAVPQSLVDDVIAGAHRGVQIRCTADRAAILLQRTRGGRFMRLEAFKGVDRIPPDERHRLIEPLAARAQGEPLEELPVHMLASDGRLETRHDGWWWVADNGTEEVVATNQQLVNVNMVNAKSAHFTYSQARRSDWRRVIAFVGDDTKVFSAGSARPLAFYAECPPGVRRVVQVVVDTTDGLAVFGYLIDRTQSGKVVFESPERFMAVTYDAAGLPRVVFEP